MTLGATVLTTLATMMLMRMLTPRLHKHLRPGNRTETTEGRVNVTRLLMSANLSMLLETTSGASTTILLRMIMAMSLPMPSGLISGGLMNPKNFTTLAIRSMYLRRTHISAIIAEGCVSTNLLSSTFVSWVEYHQNVLETYPNL